MLKPALAALVALSLPALAQACPEINGKFMRKLNTTNSITVGFTTKITDGKYFYNFDVDSEAPFLEADGVEKTMSHEGVSGTIKVSCSGNVVELEGKENGGPSMKQKYTLLSPTQLQIESSEPLANGIYDKI